MATISQKKIHIQNLIDTNDRAVMRAILVIYQRQTNNEQFIQTTSDRNGVGFSSYDAPILTSFAERLLGTGRNRQVGPRILTPAQMIVARYKIRRYWRQLCQVAESRGNQID